MKEIADRIYKDKKLKKIAHMVVIIGFSLSLILGTIFANIFYSKAFDSYMSTVEQHLVTEEQIEVAKSAMSFDSIIKGTFVALIAIIVTFLLYAIVQVKRAIIRVKLRRLCFENENY